jgi:ferritin-like metal-binding protein YciE
MVMTLDSQEKVYIHELKDLYNAENQLIEALPKVIKSVNDEQLKKDITAHLNETKQHAARIEKIMKNMDASPAGVKCKGMEGLIEEGDEMMKEKELPEDLLTDALVTGAQKIEQYEIHAYESAIKAARELGQADAASVLEQSLQEERAAYEKLHAFSQAN